MKNLLITDRFSQEALAMLESQAFFQVEKCANYDLSNLDLQKYHGLIIRSRTQISEALLNKAKNLQVIITSTSGFEHINLQACERWGVTVMFTPDAHIESVTQLTWSLVLACANHLIKANANLRKGDWNRDSLIGIELQQKTFGVVGLGRIGMRVAAVATAFGMEVLAYDPYCDELNFQKTGCERVAYEELLKRSDFVSFHVPSTKETTRMLNRSQFEFIRRGCVLVNTARGSVIHEADLLEALEQGLVAACGLDVFEKEPLPPQSKLLKLENVLVTPHIGANTQEAFQKASESAALKMIRFFVDSSTSDTLPPKAAWYGAQTAV